MTQAKNTICLWYDSNNLGKPAAWGSASHVEKEQMEKGPPTP